MVNTVQASYSERMDVGRPGMIVGCDYETITGICETVAGLAFGIAVSQGSADKGVIIGGSAAGFLGATVRDVTLENAQLDKYAQYQNVGVMKRGKMWVTVDSAVAVGAAVYFIGASGKFTDVSGGNVGPIKGARFATTAEDEAVALVELSGHLNN